MALSPERLNLLTALVKRPGLLPGALSAGFGVIRSKVFRGSDPADQVILPEVARARDSLLAVLENSATAATPATPATGDGKPAPSLKHLPTVVLPAGPASPMGHSSAGLRLATFDLEPAPTLDWERRFADPEDLFALHRFGWLLSRLLADDSTEAALTGRQAIAWLDDWISRMGDRTDHPGWESYSVAERLANWPLIVALLRSRTAVPDGFEARLAGSMAAQVRHLAGHLEFHGRFTNNHLLNDARGLYLGGAALDIPEACELGRALFRDWTPRLFSPDGLLLEHSSHYQFLLTQRYEQVWLTAGQIGDRAFADELRPWVERMRGACGFFRVPGRAMDGEIPLFGDVSPDFSPDWVGAETGIGWELAKRRFGWAGPVAGGEARPALERLGPFVRATVGGTTLFLHVNEAGASFSHHGHDDLGGFVLYRDGLPLIVDPGRPGYLPADWSAKTAHAHGTIAVDGLGPVCEDRIIDRLGLLPAQTAALECRQEGGEIVIRIASSGFVRLAEPLEWVREFRLDVDRLRVVDRLSGAGSGKHRVEWRLPFAPEIRLESEGGEWSARPGGLRIGVFGKTAVEASWYSPRYGKKEPASMLVWRDQFRSCADWNWEVRWNP